VCKTTSSALERGHLVSIQGKEASSSAGETPSARMVAVRTSIRKKGFSGRRCITFVFKKVQKKFS
jgi:hypothetical protein